MLLAPPYWKDGQPPEDVNTAEEESAQFSCEVEGVPTPDIKWLVNGVPIEGMFMTVLCCGLVNCITVAGKTSVNYWAPASNLEPISKATVHPSIRQSVWNVQQHVLLLFFTISVMAFHCLMWFGCAGRADTRSATYSCQQLCALCECDQDRRTGAAVQRQQQTWLHLC